MKIKEVVLEFSMFEKLTKWDRKPFVFKAERCVSVRATSLSKAEVECRRRIPRGKKVIVISEKITRDDIFNQVTAEWKYERIK